MDGWMEEGKRKEGAGSHVDDDLDCVLLTGRMGGCGRGGGIEDADAEIRGTRRRY
jgi:hypothetical protein